MKNITEDGYIFKIFPNFAKAITELSYILKHKKIDNYQEINEKLTEILVAAKIENSQILNKIHKNEAMNFAEQQLIRYGSIDYIKSIERSFGGIGIEPVLEAQKLGNGLILGCTHIGLFYHALIKAKTICNSILIVSGNQNYSPAAVERLEKITEIEIKIINSKTTSSLKISRHLRRGGVVATMLDYYTDNILSFITPFFGRDAKTPAGIYQIAQMNQTPIVPIAVTSNNKGSKLIEINSIINNLASPIDLAMMANQKIELMIRKNPEAWSAWSSLPYRWKI